MTLFKAWKSTHRQRLPSFFLMNSTGEPHGDLLGQMNPFLVFSSKKSLSAVSSGGNRGWISPWKGFVPSSRLILRLYGWCGASMLAFSPENTLQKSWYSWGTLFSRSFCCAVDTALALSQSRLVQHGLGACWVPLGDSRKVMLSLLGRSYPWSSYLPV